MAFQELIKGTPDWHEKYNSDFQDVHAQLANKVNEVYISESKGDSFDFDHPDQGYGTYYLSILKVPGMPAELENGSGTLIYGQGSHDRWRQQLLLSQRGEVWYRTEYDRSSEEGNQGVWKAWKRLITNEPPQTFNLPLNSNFSGEAKYLKNALGTVCIILRDVKKKDGSSFSSAESIGILPEGYRPNVSHRSEAIVTLTDADGAQAQYARLTAASNGDLGVWNSNAKANNLVLTGGLVFPVV